MDRYSSVESESSSVSEITEDSNVSSGSVSQVLFTGFSNVYERDSEIVGHYKLKPGIESLAGDRIALYRIGWTNISEFVSFIYVNSNRTEDDIRFPSKDLRLSEPYYQLCYLTGGNLIFGCSLPFSFNKRRTTDQTEEFVGREEQHSIRNILSSIAELEQRLDAMVRDESVAKTQQTRPEIDMNPSTSRHINVNSGTKISNLLAEKCNLNPIPENGINLGKYEKSSEELILKVKKLEDELLTLESRYRNEVVKNADMIRKCKQATERENEIISLQRKVQALVKANESWQRQITVLEEQRNKIKDEYSLLRSTSAEQIADLMKDCQKKNINKKKDHNESTNNWAYEMNQLLATPVKQKNCPPSECLDCKSLNASLKLLKAEKVKLSSELIQIKHANTLHLRLLKESNDSANELKSINCEIKSQLAELQKRNAYLVRL